MRKKEKTKESLGRKKFEKKYGSGKNTREILLQSTRRLGASRLKSERFTMDDDFTEAVMEVFCALYDEGLIYRGFRLANWDVELQTALSDLEVISTEEQGFIWEISYKKPDSGNRNVATTRPETMLGDVAIAVNPKDKRYKKFIGKNAFILNDRDTYNWRYLCRYGSTGCLKLHLDTILMILRFAKKIIFQLLIL